MPTTSKPNGFAVNMYGDSLTAGGQDGSQISFETALSSALSIPVTNNGISSQKSTQIAMRQGGVPIQLSFASNQIVYSTQAVTAVEGAPLVGMSTTEDPDYRFLSNLGSNQSQIVYGSVCGVHGFLTVSASGGPPSTAQGYYFTPDGQYPQTNLLSAAPQVCAAQSVFTPDAAGAQRIQPAIFWYGTNNASQLAQIESDLTGSIAYLGHSNYICLTIPVSEGNPSGSTNYNTYMTANAGIASTCGVAHTFDIHEFLVGQYNPSNPVDLYDHANDIVPYTMRAVITRGTVSAISSTSTCSFTITPVFGGVTTAVMKVDNEFINITGVSGSTVTGCTRGFGTGGVAATHSAGAAITITDNLHIGGNADVLAANYVAANYKGVLLGSTPTTLPNNTAIGGLLGAVNTWTASQYFQLPLFVGSGEIWEGSMCISQAQNPYTQQLSGPLSNVLCATSGNGTITIGGAQNTQVCITNEGAACVVGLNSSNQLATKGEIKGLTTITTGATSGSPYVTLPGDRIIEVNKTSGTATSITLMASPKTGQVYTIKDGKGDAGTNVITVTPTAGNVDGASSATVNSAYGKLSLIYDGMEWVSI